ncbi:MAG: XRE family transcriptional regulator [Bacteroidales bacterium]|nr:XRE family transcriptional regulator [Bacteroidales bacterium]
MSYIKTEKEYAAIMARIDQLFFETNEETPSDDPRLKELDMLSALVEEYEKEVYPIRL